MTGIPSMKNFNFPMRIKLSVRNGLILKPAWFEAMLASPDPLNDIDGDIPKYLKREDFPETLYKREFANRFPNRWIKAKTREENNITFMRNFPEDNRWFQDPTIFYALRKLAYVQRGYSENDATELVIRDFESKKLELEYEKELATRQAQITGSKRVSAAELLQETVKKMSRKQDVQARKKELERVLAPKKEAIRMGIAPRLTPRDIKPSDADFYLTSTELKERIEEQLSKEQSIEGTYFGSKEKKADLSHATKSATITSGVNKRRPLSK